MFALMNATMLSLMNSPTERPRLSFARALCISLTVRIFFAIFTRTEFQPDEWYQSLVPAHRAVFGWPDLTWEWLQPIPSSQINIFGLVIGPGPIRNPLHVLWYTPAYLAIKYLGLNGTPWQVWLPKLFNVPFAVTIDMATAQLAYTIHDAASAYDHAFALSILNPWAAFAHTRSLINIAEAALSGLALLFWPLSDAQVERSRSGWGLLPRQRWRIALAIAGINVVMRPTNAIFWSVLGLCNLYRREIPDSWVLQDIPIAAALAALLSVGLESMYYGRLTITALNFFYANIYQGVASYYGVSGALDHMTVSLPIILGPTLPLTVIALFHYLRQKKSTGFHYQAITRLWQLCFGFVAAYSFFAHKEWRFMSPMFTPLVALSASGLTKARRWYMTITAAAALPVIIYATRYHKMAGISIAHHIKPTPMLVLVPCYGTQGPSFVTNPAVRHALEKELAAKQSFHSFWREVECPPPLGLDYSYTLWQNDFFDKPIEWLDSYFNDEFKHLGVPDPSKLQQIIIYKGLFNEKPSVMVYLGKKGYLIRWQQGNGLFVGANGPAADHLLLLEKKPEKDRD